MERSDGAIKVQRGPAVCRPSRCMRSSEDLPSSDGLLLELGDALGEKLLEVFEGF